MFCGKCGHANPDAGSFCTKCGAALEANALATDRSGSAVLPTATATTTTTPASIDTRQDSGTGRGLFDAEAWAAAIGPRNTDYYLKRFELQFRTGRRAHWHWPAFFCTFYWLLYRKAWGWAALFFLAPYIVSATLAASIQAISKNDEVVATIVWSAYFAALFFVPPIVANGIYYARCRKLLTRLAKLNLSRERYLAQAEAQGGTSRIVAIVVGIFVLVAVIGILAAIALPAYQDYTKRAKTSEAIMEGMTLARAVGAYYDENHSIPAAADVPSFGPIASRYVAGIELDPKSSVITIAIQFDPGTTSGHIVLTPFVDKTGKVGWRCAPGEAGFRKFTPLACRNE